MYWSRKAVYSLGVVMVAFWITSSPLPDLTRSIGQPAASASTEDSVVVNDISNEGVFSNAIAQTGDVIRVEDVVFFSGDARTDKVGVYADGAVSQDTAGPVQGPVTAFLRWGWWVIVALLVFIVALAVIAFRTRRSDRLRRETKQQQERARQSSADSQNLDPTMDEPVGYGPVPKRYSQYRPLRNSDITTGRTDDDASYYGGRSQNVWWPPLGTPWYDDDNRHQVFSTDSGANEPVHGHHHDQSSAGNDGGANSSYTDNSGYSGGSSDSGSSSSSDSSSSSGGSDSGGGGGGSDDGGG